MERLRDGLFECKVSRAPYFHGSVIALAELRAVQTCERTSVAKYLRAGSNVMPLTWLWCDSMRFIFSKG